MTMTTARKGPAPHTEPGGVQGGVEIQLFTDPACPFAFSHEPVRRRLGWLYGEGLTWRPRMIVLASSDRELRERGVTAELVTHIRRRLADRSGMPIAAGGQVAPPSPTRPAALAVVGARTWGQAASARVLRELRVLIMSGRSAGAAETIREAALRAGLDPDLLRARMDLAESRDELEREMEAARAPSAAAVSLAHLLTSFGDGFRYSAPSYLLTAPPVGRPLPLGTGQPSRFTVPGAQPAVAYEAAIANMAPQLPRTETPEDPREVLAWAGEPLATAEVAAVMDLDLRSAARGLHEVADFSPAANDGYWSI